VQEMSDWLRQLWDWLWIYRRGKIKIRVFKFGDSYEVMASDGTTSVWNCFGSTPEVAKEIARFRLKQTVKEHDAVVATTGYTSFKETPNHES
jgi:phage-related protein